MKSVTASRVGKIDIPSFLVILDDIILGAIHDARCGNIRETCLLSTSIDTFTRLEEGKEHSMHCLSNGAG